MQQNYVLMATRK